MVYPVYSRRSRGLSVGINLFPQKRICLFDCPYCEIFDFYDEGQNANRGTDFDLDNLKEDLISALARAKKEHIPVKDICFSGSGEPTLSPHFSEALETAARIRDEFVPDAELVLITNASGLLQKNIFHLLKEKALEGLRVWLKIDAATEEWFRKMNQPRGIDFQNLQARIRDFAAEAPFISQTMICKVEGSVPSQEEERAWIKLICDLAQKGKLRSVQIYGKARPSPKDPMAEAADVSILETRARALREALHLAAREVLVEVFP